MRATLYPPAHWDALAPLQAKSPELIVALDCVEIDLLAPLDEVVAAQDLADRVAAMLTKLIRSADSGLS